MIMCKERRVCARYPRYGTVRVHVTVAKRIQNTLHVDVADDAVYLDTDGSLNHPAASNKHHLALSTHAYRLTQRVHTCMSAWELARAHARVKRLTNGQAGDVDKPIIRLPADDLVGNSISSDSCRGTWFPVGWLVGWSVRELASKRTVRRHCLVDIMRWYYSFRDFNAVHSKPNQITDPHSQVYKYNFEDEPEKLE